MVICVVECTLCFFFFQAEDGIRDLVRSRGLGDVYKRQILYQGVTSGWYPPLIFLGIGAMTDFSALISNPKSVSYTHLTLPTSDLV